MFRAIDVWRREEASRTLIRYRCFEVLPGRGFCVQSKDRYRFPLDTDRVRFLDANFLELLEESHPAMRAGLFPTLEDAIQAHEAAFSEDLD